ncbi:MAG: lysine biosynthesis protein LysW [Candidatus Gracilibacteria bacterium]|nr:lysine biosynthesis protein LysW [Candidatus Gracilibacteria bacterium]
MDNLKGICPECELRISFKSKKPGSTFLCPECDTVLEIIDIDGSTADLDYAEEEDAE